MLIASAAEKNMPVFDLNSISQFMLKNKYLRIPISKSELKLHKKFIIIAYDKWLENWIQESQNE